MASAALGVVVSLVAVVPIPGASGAQEQFASPEAAVSAFVAALADGSHQRIQAVLGAEMADHWSTRDMAERASLLEAVRHGKFSVPLTRTENGWQFDQHAAVSGLVEQRIYRNESAVVELCRRYVEAQFEYFQETHTFAQSIRSTPGQRDGLYWSIEGATDESPLGPSFARAAFVESSGGDPTPYFGYYFKVISSAVSHGFALIAWPAQHGATGRRSFIIDHLSELYSQDLGGDTPHRAAAIESFTPDRGWTRIIDNE
jgi:hypothetical protein